MTTYTKTPTGYQVATKTGTIVINMAWVKIINLNKAKEFFNKMFEQGDINQNFKKS